MPVGHALSRFRLREFNRNVRLFFAFGTSINAGMALFSLLYNLYLLRLSYQEDFIGQVASMAPLATGLLALPIGILSDRLGRKPFLVASGLLLAISQLGLCLTTSPSALLAFSFIGGVAMAFVWVNHVPFLSDNAPPSASRRSPRHLVGPANNRPHDFEPNRRLHARSHGLLSRPFYRGPCTLPLRAVARRGLFAHSRRAAVVRIRSDPPRKSTRINPVAGRQRASGLAVAHLCRHCRLEWYARLLHGADVSVFQRVLRGRAGRRAGRDRSNLLSQPTRQPASDLRRADADAPLRADAGHPPSPHCGR